jgi:hypothetical protein
MMNRRSMLAVALGALGTTSVGEVGLIQALASATPLAKPTDKPILTISGAIEITNEPGAAIFDRAMIEAIGIESFETTTPWYTAKVKFEGVNMAKLLKKVGAKGQKITVTALNDYKTDIPVEDFAKYGAILALKRDGNYMPVSDKGPLFIVYPYDAHAELKSQKFYGRSAWQVAKIEVK